MKRLMRMTLVLLAVCSLVLLSACGPKVDYRSAEAVEKALNAGEKLDGKIGRVKVNKVTDSGLGYVAEAGEHLNFYSVNDPMIKDGSTITVRIDTATNLLGVWMITYTKV